MSKYLKSRYVWWRRWLCVIGIHRLSDDWGIHWSSKTQYTECEYCKKSVGEYNHWAIAWDWLRSKFRVEPKYETSPFWKWLTPKATRIILIDRHDEIVARVVPKDIIILTEFIELLNRSHLVEVRRKGWWGMDKDEELDSMQVLLLLATAENK